MGNVSREALTSSPVLCRRMNLPSVSSSSTHTAPVAEAEWAMETELPPASSCSSGSTRFLLPTVVRTLRLLLLDVARDTVTRDDGLGDSCSLDDTHTHTHREREVNKWPRTILF